MNYPRAVVVSALLVPQLSAAQARPAARPYHVDYSIAMPDVASHLYSITLEVSGVTGRTVNLQMPVWSPVRYGRMDFAKNVQDSAVSSADGPPPRWDQGNGTLCPVL